MIHPDPRSSPTTTSIHKGPELKHAMTTANVTMAKDGSEVVIVKAQNMGIYKLEAANSLPVLNLRLTLSWYLLTPTKNVRFLKWVRANYRNCTQVCRGGLALGFLSLLLPRVVGVWLVIPAALCTLPAPLCSFAMLSTDMLRILLRNYEFWFFTSINVLTWAALARMFDDIRGVYPIVLAMETQVVLFTDANFRTFVPVIKTAAFTVPAMVILGVAVMLRLPDVPERHYESVSLGAIAFDPVDFFMNALIVLVFFLIRLIFNKRQLLYSRNAGTRVVRCVLLRAQLTFRPMISHIGERRRAYTSRVVLKQLGITTQKVIPTLRSTRSARSLNHRQQVTLVSLRLSTIDVRRTIGYHLLPQNSRTPLRRLYLIGLYVVGAVGLASSTFCLLLPGHQDIASIPSHLYGSVRVWLQALPLIGFVGTFTLVSIFAASYQRDLARALFRNFVFLFPSLQFAFASVCLADAMEWDQRVWAVAAFFLWFHWMLALDALTPPMRQRLGFRSYMAIPVVLSIWIGLVVVAYAIFIDSAVLADRVLISWTWGDQALQTRTKSMLLNRILTIFVWTVRLMWQLVFAGKDELVLLRGTLDYYCPFDTFTGVRSSGMIPLKSKRNQKSESTVIIPQDSSIGPHESSRRVLARSPSEKKLETARRPEQTRLTARRHRQSF